MPTPYPVRVGAGPIIALQAYRAASGASPSLAGVTSLAARLTPADGSAGSYAASTVTVTDAPNGKLTVQFAPAFVSVAPGLYNLTVTFTDSSGTPQIWPDENGQFQIIYS